MTNRIPNQYLEVAILRYVSHFKITQAIPIDQDITYAEATSKAGVDEGQLKINFRLLISSFHPLTEPRPGFIAHVAASKLLVIDTSLVGRVWFMAEESYHASAKIVEAIERWGTGGSHNETAFNIAFDTELPLFEWLGQHPGVMARFAEAMKANANSESYNVSHAAAGYNWKGLGASLVVDVSISSLISIQILTFTGRRIGRSC